jgi:hypothetical protein
MEVGGQRHAPAALPPGKTRYPLYNIEIWNIKMYKMYGTKSEYIIKISINFQAVFYSRETL